MLLKEAKICCAFSWSPSAVASPMIATGAVAGAMDDDFNSEAHLEIRCVDIHNGDSNSKAMKVIGRTLMADRVFRIDWSPHGGANGIIAGCFTDGSVHVWSVDKILENFAKDESQDTEDPVLCRIAAHNGAVRALQFSPTQPHFLATGGQDKELCIWSLENPPEPQAVPALTKSTHTAEITDVKWNPKFAHILATCTANGAVVVWDLKARRTALTFNVSASQPGAAVALAWHPDVSTHIAVARDEVNPVIQLWDLKKAMAPIRELKGHAKGVTGLSWNNDDPSLLLSCGCDGRTLCWNPLTGDLLGELPVQENWIYQVQWSPKLTAVAATSSFDSSLGVYSAQEVAAGGSGSSRTVPKWLRRPCGAVFGFGGRIAAPVKNTNHIALSVTLKGDARGDKEFRQALIANPPNTNQRVEFLRSLGYDLLAASTECQVVNSRLPLLKFLGLDPEEVSAAVDNISSPYTAEEEEFEVLLSRCIVAGRIPSAVKLCLAAGRFDDAFAVAQLGTSLSPLTREVAAGYVTSCKLRYSAYLGAVLLDRFDELFAAANLPYKEVLSLLAVYSNNTFAQHAKQFASALKERKEIDGAAAAFVAAGDVNAAVELYATTALSAQKLVQLATVVEQTVGAQCTASPFAQALSVYAGALANAGDFEGALILSNRAAGLGDVAAAVVADRIQYHVPSAAAVRVGFPFTLAVVPDAVSIECHMLCSRQPAVATRAAQPTAVPQPTPVAQPTTVAHVAPGAQRNAPASTNTVSAAPYGAQPARHADPAATASTMAMAGGAPRVSAPVPGPSAAPTPYVAQPPQLPLPQPASVAHSMPTSVQPVALPPPVAPAVVPPPHASAHLPSSAPPLPTGPPPTTGHSAQPTAAPVPQRAPVAAAALPPAAIAAFNVASLASPTHQAIAQGIIAATAKVTDKRKRDSIEKSAAELFDRLSKGVISDSVAEMLLCFTQSIGTPAAKDNWRKLSDANFDAVQPFLNLKFL